MSCRWSGHFEHHCFDRQTTNNGNISISIQLSSTAYKNSVCHDLEISLIYVVLFDIHNLSVSSHECSTSPCT